MATPIGNFPTAPAEALADLGWESLHQFAVQHGLKLHQSHATDEEQSPRAFVIWTAEGDGLAILPASQQPATSMLQLREEITEREQEAQRARDFQAGR